MFNMVYTVFTVFTCNLSTKWFYFPVVDEGPYQTKMDKMFGRLRSMSATKKNLVNSTQPNTAATPTKEDILTTLDGFGEKIQGKNQFHDLE